MQIQDRQELLKVILASLALSLWMYWIWTRRKLYKFCFKLPCLWGIPLLGVLIGFRGVHDMLPACSRFFRKCKNYTLCAWFGVTPVLLTADPYIAEKVLTSTDLLNKAPLFYSPLNDILGGGMVTSPAAKWQHNRKRINPAFHHKVLLSFLSVFNKTKNNAIKYFGDLDNGQAHKLHKLIQRITLGVAVETTMDRQLYASDESKNEQIVEMFTSLMEQAFHQLAYSFLGIGSLHRICRKYRSIKTEFHSLIKELLDSRLIKSLTQSGCQQEMTEKSTVAIEDDTASLQKTHNIFIDQAIQTYKQRQLTYSDIINECQHIVVGSFETTAILITSLIAMLAMHQDVQQRLFEEILTVFPEKDFEMAYEHVDQLPYLHMVINETLRLSPSIPTLGRHVVKETKLNEDLTLPKGLQILISVFHLQRRKDIWGENAHKFDPDHFLPENMCGKHPYAFIPFSKGTRNCIGWRYAMLSMKVMITALVRNFRFSTDFKYEDFRYVVHMTLTFAKEPTIQIERR